MAIWLQLVFTPAAAPPNRAIACRPSVSCPRRVLPARLFAASLGAFCALPAAGWSTSVFAQAAPAAAPAQGIDARPKTIPLPPTEPEEITRLIRAKDLDGALKRADTFLAKNPRDLQVRFLRGLILTDQNKTADAVTVFETLTQDFPELPEPYNNLAVLRAGQGQLDLARTLLQQAIIAQPNYVTAYENLGDVYVSLAAESYQRALSLDPNNRNAQNKLTLAREISAKLRTVR
jgi:tetratricopeptide (TPR) repeat protein